MRLIDKLLDEHGHCHVVLGPGVAHNSNSLICMDCKNRRGKPLFLAWVSQSDAQDLESAGMQLEAEYRAYA